jgi:hypothetical protein
MWNVKCFLIPIITGATKLVTEDCNTMGTVPGEHSVDSGQNAAVLGTSHIIR